MPVSPGMVSDSVKKRARLDGTHLESSSVIDIQCLLHLFLSTQILLIVEVDASLHECQREV